MLIALQRVFWDCYFHHTQPNLQKQKFVKTTLLVLCRGNKKEISVVSYNLKPKGLSDVTCQLL